MPKLVVTDAALLTLHWGQGTVTWVNVIGARVLPTTTIDQTLANLISASIMSAFTGGTLIAQLHTTTALQRVSLRDIRNPDLPDFVGSATGAVGTGTGDPLPRQSALVVTLRTAKAGQSYRGRIYYGGFTEAVNDTTGNAAAAAASASVSFTTAIGSTLSANGLILAVVSRPAERVVTVETTHHADGTTDVETKTRNARVGLVTDVTLIETRNTTWDSQRRRSAPGSGSTFFGTPGTRAELLPAVA